MARWTKRLEWPHSLSYQLTNFTKVSLRAMPALMSTIEDAGQVTKSVDTTSSSLAIISSILAGFSREHVKSTTDTSGVGTRKAMPVNLPFNAGRHLPTAFAAPVADGIMF